MIWSVGGRRITALWMVLCLIAVLKLCFDRSILSVAAKEGVTVKLESMAAYEKKDENGKILSEWYPEIPEKIVITCSNEIDENGILAVSVTLDGMELTDYAVDNSNETTVQQNLQVEIRQEDISHLSKGEHFLAITVKDFEGNATTEEFVIGIDNGAPVITEAEFTEAESVEGRLNSAGFHNFYNKSVQMMLTVEDTAEEGSMDTSVPNVGAKEAVLYLNGEEYETVQVDEDNHAVFVFPKNLSDNQFVKYTQVSVITRDFLGNQSGHILIEEDKNGSLIIETRKPVIEDVDIKTQGEHALRTEKTDSAAVFYCKSDENGRPDIDFIVKASDKDENAGLEKIKVVFHDQIIFEDNYEENLQLFAALTEGEKSFSLNNSLLTGESEYHGTIAVTDKAGNETVFEMSVYVDTEGPAVGATEITAEKSKVSNTSYFNGAVVVTAMPEDAGVGAAEIEWGIIGTDNVQKKVDTVSINTDGKASFTIMPTVDTAYEESIYIRAIDKLGNVGLAEELGVIVIETQEQHDKQSEQHIRITNQTPSIYKDAAGNPLYTGRDISTLRLKIAAEDTYNGIKKIAWTVSSELGIYTELAGSAAVNSETFTVIGTNGIWQVEEGTDFVSKMNGIIELNPFAIEANNIMVTVTMTDLSGNTSTDSIVFSVDNTEPKIVIAFDTAIPDSEFTNVYQGKRTATITVTDRNFGKEQLIVEVTNSDGAVPQISDWKVTATEEMTNVITSTATLEFTEDGDYSVRIGGKDLAGLEAETVIVEEFTIDTIDPVIKVTYTNENTRNGNYYARTQTAVITIEEHNFTEERIEIAGMATLGGTDTVFPELSAWKSEGDIHTATLTFDTDGLYQFYVDYKDKAGREANRYMGEAFYVDMTAPVIEITGVEDLSANNGEVAPRISITDFNYNPEGVTIALCGANGGKRTINGVYEAQADGQLYTFANFEEEQENDDIYTVTVTAADMAGNEAENEITFSVNRFGSVYVFDGALKEIAGKYIQEEIDVRLTEINVDRLERDTIRVSVNANGVITDLQEGTDYKVLESGGNGAWHQYDYIIDKSLFAGDGRYMVTLYSEDAAGNKNENLAESKKAEISFGIDKTPPVIIPIDIADREQYAEEVKTATVAVNDNLVLRDVQIFVGEKQSEYTTEGENYIFSIPGMGEPQDITIVASDAAGNRTHYVINGVLVTTNTFIRWYHNTPLFVGSIVGVTVLGGAGAGFIGLHRRRRVPLKSKA